MRNAFLFGSLNKTKMTTPHCEHCGQEHPTVYDGYTACCNEPTCFGETDYRFGTESEHVRACCWGKAFKVFESEGREVPDRARCLD